MFATLRVAARLIFDPALTGVVFKAIGLTILLFAAALAVGEYGVSLLPVLSSPLVNEALRWMAPFLFLFGGMVLGPPVAALFASLFLDEVASRIEARDYPGWHAWPAALAGMVYARRPRTSPPLVVRATSVNQLRTEIEIAEQERGLR